MDRIKEAREALKGGAVVKAIRLILKELEEMDKREALAKCEWCGHAHACRCAE